MDAKTTLLHSAKSRLQLTMHQLSADRLSCMQADALNKEELAPVNAYKPGLSGRLDAAVRHERAPGVRALRQAPSSWSEAVSKRPLQLQMHQVVHRQDAIVCRLVH